MSISTVSFPFLSQESFGVECFQQFCDLNHLQVDQWWVKPLKPWRIQGINSVVSEMLEKSGNFISIYLGTWEVITRSHALESITHILFMLYYDESKRHHKMMPAVFCHTISLECEGLWSSYIFTLNELYG